MTRTFKIKLPDRIEQLSLYRKERLEQIVSILNDNKQVSGVLLGGSLSYKNDIEKSDIDLFCLINDVKEFESKLNENLAQLENVDEIIFQGNFPWTEKLYTIYFKQDIDFSIDLCLINSDKSATFFWEPDGYILFDKEQLIEQCRLKQMNNHNFTRQPFLKQNPFSLSIVTLKKIEKNLSRNHLWNALEQLNSLRRYLMQIIRLKEIKHDYFLGRVDRDVEDIMPTEINNSLSKTVAIYDKKDIAEKTILLIDLLETQKKHLKQGSEKQFENWILKQAQRERNKLATYL